MSCPICHNDITDINKVITECNHVFHFTCIYKNLKTNISTGEQCPLCRKNFNTSTQSFSLCPPRVTIGEQQLRIIRNLFRTPQIHRPRNTLVRIEDNTLIHHRHTVRRRREIKKQIAELSFSNLKNKLREKGVSSRGYLRDTLENRLFDKMIAE